MCGIVGFVKLDPENKKNLCLDNVKEAFRETSNRGKQATGFYSPTTGTIKTADDADKFVDRKEKELKEAIKSGVLLGHCRIATGGFDKHESPPSIMENNHPHEGKRYVLVHNGHFSHLPKLKKYKYKGNCDSELALSYIETWGIEKGIKLMAKSDGYSLVVYDKEDKIVYFYRESNPLVYSYDIETSCLVFGSTTDIVMEFANPMKQFGLDIPTLLAPHQTNNNYLMSVKIGEGYKHLGEIKPRTTDTELHSLPEEIKSKMDLDGFFVVKTWEVEQDRVPRHRNYAAYGASGMDYARPTSRGALMVFTVIKNGLLKFSGPLTYVGESTERMT